MADHGYEWAVARVTDMEVDLSSAVTALKRSQADNETLIANQADLVTSYKRLQDHHERLRCQLHQEQEERQQLTEEQQHQISLWRSQIDLRDRDIEELQTQRMAPREIDAIHLQLAEEIEEPYRQQVRDLEVQLRAAQDRSEDARRQMEAMRMEQKLLEQEHREQLAEHDQRQDVREQALQRQIASLEAEVRTQMDAATGTWNLKMQMQEQEAKLLGMQSALQEQEQSSAQERKASATEIEAHSSKLSASQRRMHELEVNFDAEKRLSEQTAAETQDLRRDQTRLSAQLTEAKAKLATAKPCEEFNQLQEEISQVKRSATTEREKLLKQISALEEQQQTEQAPAKQVEFKLRQLEDEWAEREREFKAETDELDRTRSTEISKLRADLDKSTSEAELRRVTWVQKEKDLKSQLQTSVAQAETLGDELEQCQLSREEIERQLQEFRHDGHRKHSTALEENRKHSDSLQTQLATHIERVTVLEHERHENASAAQTAREAHQLHEQRANALQADLAATSQRLDAERIQWVRDADEAQAAATRLEEERRKSAMQQSLEDHKRQMAKLNSAYKKALQKATRKQEEMKKRCQDLVKRIGQLQQEKATAIRICEENKAAYEIRLTELGLVSRLGLGSVGVGAAEVVGLSSPAILRGEAGVNGASMMHRRELRAIMERLEQNSERLQASALSA